MSERQQKFRAGSPTTSSTVNVDTGGKWSTETMATLLPLLLKSGVLLTGTATWDAGSIADGDMESKDVTVTGAALGDFVVGVSMGVDTVDLGVVGAVTATNTATATLLNNTGGAVDLASTTVRVVVLPKSAVGL